MQEHSLHSSMEALLHQAALQPPPHTPKPPSWMHSNPSPHIISPSNRRRAATPQLQTAGRGFGVAVTDKKSSKQKQQQELLETFGDSSKSSEDEELPQVVFDRIIRRVLFSVGLPIASGVGLLYVYDALKHGHGVAVPGWLPFVTILFAFGTSAFGIAYATLTASWDPEKEGSLLGLEEAQTNWPELWKDEADKK